MKQPRKSDILKKVRPLVRSFVHAQAHPPFVSVGWPAYDEREILSAFGSLLDLRLSLGPAVRSFEEHCARYVGVKYATAVNSGSSANLVALSALVACGYAPAGSEVIVPASTFATVASPVTQAGLIPVYVDVDPQTWNIDPKEIEKAITPKTRVIMAVHMLGNPAPMPKIMAIAHKHKLMVIEDCCEAHGARIGDRVVGSFGHIATLSFFVAHNITTGEGGMIFTNDTKLRDRFLSLREFGRLPPSNMKKRLYHDPHLGNYDARYVFVEQGYNLRMTDIAASLGIEQLKKLDRLNKKRLQIVGTYLASLKCFERYLQLPVWLKGNFHSFYAFGMIVKEQSPHSREKLVQYLEDRGIETRSIFAGCLPDQPGFRHTPHRVVGSLPVSRLIRDRGIFIGCHPALTPKHVQTVLNAFRDAFATR